MICETWSNQFQNIDIDGYKCYAVHRSLIKPGSKRNSGGIACYIRSHLESGIQYIKSDSDDILWLKLCKDFFLLQTDIFICLTYIVPESSGRNALIEEDVLDRIALDMVDIQNDNNYDVHFLIVGDMNGRTGELPDFVENDFSRHLPTPEEYIEDAKIPERVSLDKTVNNAGKNILSFCKMCRLSIVNGRTGKDRDIGKWTCTKYNGQSVVDYVICSRDLYPKISSFEVSDPLPFSDHSAVYFSLEIGQPIDPTGTTGSYHKLRWHNDKKIRVYHELRK